MAGDAIPHDGCFTVPKKYPFLVPKKLARMGLTWAPSALTYGAFLGAGFLYFTDWQLFMDKLPFYGGKFRTEDEETK